MAEINCTLPMQVMIEIKMDDDTHELEGWSIAEHSVEMINSFLRQVAQEISVAAKIAETHKEGDPSVFAVGPDGVVIDLDEVKEAALAEMVSEIDPSKETKH